MNWFNRKGLFYQPVSLAGWTTLAIAVASSIYMFFKIDSSSHSASDTLRNWVFVSLLIAAAYSLIGYLTEKK
jgi:hypothetical protein